MLGTKRILSAATAVGGAATLVLASPAIASFRNGPFIKYFMAPIPVVGSVLSDSSNTPGVKIKDGWAIYDGDGICSASTDVFHNDPRWTRTVWNAPRTGPSVTSLLGNAYTGMFKANTDIALGISYLSTTATDCRGNSSWEDDIIAPGLYQQGAASYGAGWSRSSSTKFSGGSVMQSSTVGAEATFKFSDVGAQIVALVSDQASNRGKVSISVDGGAATTVTLTKSTTTNRVIVWKSKYLSAYDGHWVTVKVVSGRVDIDAFLTLE